VTVLAGTDSVGGVPLVVSARALMVAGPPAGPLELLALAVEDDEGTHLVRHRPPPWSWPNDPAGYAAGSSRRRRVRTPGWP
jgi:hypothetical protein